MSWVDEGSESRCDYRQWHKKGLWFLEDVFHHHDVEEASWRQRRMLKRRVQQLLKLTLEIMGRCLCWPRTKRQHLTRVVTQKVSVQTSLRDPIIMIYTQQIQHRNKREICSPDHSSRTSSALASLLVKPHLVWITLKEEEQCSWEKHAKICVSRCTWISKCDPLALFFGLPHISVCLWHLWWGGEVSQVTTAALNTSFSLLWKYDSISLVIISQNGPRLCLWFNAKLHK